MNVTTFALISASTLHLDQHDRADIMAAIGAEPPCVNVQRTQLGQRGIKCCLPVSTLTRVEIKRHFYHAFPIQFAPRDLD